MAKADFLKPLSAMFFCALMAIGCDSRDKAEEKAAEAAAGKTPVKAEAASSSSDSSSALAVTAPARARSDRGMPGLNDPFGPIQPIETHGEDAGADTALSPGEDDETPEPTPEDLAQIEALSKSYYESLDVDARLDAIEEIGGIVVDAPETVNVFIDALRDPDSGIRIEAVSHLADSEAPEAVNGLLSALKDSDSEVVIEAVNGLRDRNDSNLLPEISALLHHPDADVREAAREAMEFLKEE